MIELQRVMWNINSGLTSTHPYDSRPGSWPTLDRGISFWSGSGQYKNSQIYLIGNPVVWYSATLALGVGLVAAGAWLLISRRTGVAMWAVADGELIQTSTARL